MTSGTNTNIGRPDHEQQDNLEAQVRQSAGLDLQTLQFLRDTETFRNFVNSQLHNCLLGVTENITVSAAVATLATMEVDARGEQAFRDGCRAGLATADQLLKGFPIRISALKLSAEESQKQFTETNTQLTKTGQELDAKTAEIQGLKEKEIRKGVKDAIGGAHKEWQTAREIKKSSWYGKVKTETVSVWADTIPSTDTDLDRIVTGVERDQEARLLIDEFPRAQRAEAVVKISQLLAEKPGSNPIANISDIPSEVVFIKAVATALVAIDSGLINKQQLIEAVDPQHKTTLGVDTNYDTLLLVVETSYTEAVKDAVSADAEIIQLRTTKKMQEGTEKTLEEAIRETTGQLAQLQESQRIITFDQKALQDYLKGGSSSSPALSSPDTIQTVAKTALQSFAGDGITGREAVVQSLTSTDSIGLHVFRSALIGGTVTADDLSPVTEFRNNKKTKLAAQLSESDAFDASLARVLTGTEDPQPITQLRYQLKLPGVDGQQRFLAAKAVAGLVGQGTDIRQIEVSAKSYVERMTRKETVAEMLRLKTSGVQRVILGKKAFTVDEILKNGSFDIFDGDLFVHINVAEDK